MAEMQPGRVYGVERLQWRAFRDGAWHEFEGPETEVRLKPETKTRVRPFTDHELRQQIGRVVRPKIGGGVAALITAVDCDGVPIIGFRGKVSARELLDQFEFVDYLPDGTERVEPCGVVETVEE